MVEPDRTDRSNIRQALTWFADTGDNVSLARLAGALYWFWDIRGPLSEGRAWLERVLALPVGGIPDDVRFQVLLAAANSPTFRVTTIRRRSGPRNSMRRSPKPQNLGCGLRRSCCLA